MIYDYGNKNMNKDKSGELVSKVLVIQSSEVTHLTVTVKEL
jgi:hypothetical protein